MENNSPYYEVSAPSITEVRFGFLVRTSFKAGDTPDFEFLDWERNRAIIRHALSPEEITALTQARVTVIEKSASSSEAASATSVTDAA